MPAILEHLDDPAQMDPRDLAESPDLLAPLEALALRPLLKFFRDPQGRLDLPELPVPLGSQDHQDKLETPVL